MEPIYLVLVLGVLGGAMVAAYFIRRPRKSKNSIEAEAEGRRPLDAPTINYSALNVQGVGGFGLIMVCVAISIAVPEIGRSMVAALVLGALVAGLLVMVRRRHPLPSTDGTSGANTMLKLDGDAPATPDEPQTGVRLQATASAALPVAGSR